MPFMLDSRLELVILNSWFYFKIDYRHGWDLEANCLFLNTFTDETIQTSLKNIWITSKLEATNFYQSNNTEKCSQGNGN